MPLSGNKQNKRKIYHRQYTQIDTQKTRKARRSKILLYKFFQNIDHFFHPKSLNKSNSTIRNELRKLKDARALNPPCILSPSARADRRSFTRAPSREGQSVHCTRQCHRNKTKIYDLPLSLFLRTRDLESVETRNFYRNRNITHTHVLMLEADPDGKAVYILDPWKEEERRAREREQLTLASVAEI